jgi:hypothetical protein
MVSKRHLFITNGMKKIILLAVIVLFTITVDAQKIPIGFKTKIDVYKGLLYFPTKGTDCFSSYTNSWYSEQLAALNEPVLYNNKSVVEVYRFMWIRSFDPAIIVRIEKQVDGKYMLSWKQGTGGAGYPIPKNYKIIVDKHKYITKENWDFFHYRLKQLDFNKLNTIDKSQTGMDGAEWVLEESSRNYYHVTDRWTPKPETDYYKCCDYLLSLTDLKIDPKRKY